MAEQFLIVGGTYRAGSTALFEYLAAHPQIAAARVKEVGYFLPLADDTGSNLRCGRDPLEDYLGLFDPTASPPAVKMEATPGYLHEPGVAELINSVLPTARVVLILREPVSRLVSWYKTITALRRLDPATTFDEYVQLQMNDERPVDERPYVFRALEHGLYARYVASFIEALGRDRVHVAWFDDLETAPAPAMQRVATFAGVDPSFYERYSFAVVNASLGIRRQWFYDAYARVRVSTIKATRVQPRLSTAVIRGFKRLDKRVARVVAKPADALDVAPALATALHEYYAADVDPLAAVVGEAVPWAT